MKRCSIRKCQREAKKRKICLAHYQRWMKYGDKFDKSPIVDVSNMMSRFNAKLDKPNKNGCIKWKGWKNDDGYGKFSDGDIYRFAHRMAYQLFVGDIPKDKLVLHKCDVRDCCNIDHLYLGNQSDNMKDAYQRKRKSNVGIKNGHAKLIEKDVRYIKVSFDKISCAQMARNFNVSESCIHDIKHGRSWRHI